MCRPTPVDMPRVPLLVRPAAPQVVPGSPVKQQADSGNTLSKRSTSWEINDYLISQFLEIWFYEKKERATEEHSSSSLSVSLDLSGDWEEEEELTETEKGLQKKSLSSDTDSHSKTHDRI